MIRTQPALLTLYGDYALQPRGEIGIGSLVKMLSNFGLSEQAIRSAVSRMCRTGLLKVRRVGRKSYYSLTEDGYSLLTKGTKRVYQRKNTSWDGTWSILTYSIPEQQRHLRYRLRLELGWMGYGALSEATWISPYDLSREVEDLVEKLKIKEYVQIFHAKHYAFTESKKIVSRCWNLSIAHEKYANFLEEYDPKLQNYLKRLQSGKPMESSECFVERFNLIHRYRRLPFFDPDLPVELLPENWLRTQAAALFCQYNDLLADKAHRYFDSVIREY